MKTAIIIIAHAPLASALCEVAAHVFKGQHDHLACLDIEADADRDTMLLNGIDLLRPIANERGALILTDCFGATPSNIAQAVAASHPHNTVVTGINLPMLIRVLNYQHESAAVLAKIAVDGGKNAIITPSTD